MIKAEISKKLARRLALHGQLVDGKIKLPMGKEGVAQVIEKLGYIQIDTIAVVERAHHHTLWTRRPDYHPDMLHELQAKDRRIFEYWGHRASYLPMADYRFYLPKMRNFLTSQGSWWTNWQKKHGHLMAPVLERIRKEGALSSKDFQQPDDFQRGPWWDWKPTKAALEILFWQGDLMITERRNFQRVYDLTERVLPESVDTRIPDDEELGQFLVWRALNAYGVSQEKEIREHIHGGKNVISKSLRDLVEAGEVIPLQVEGDKKSVYYASSRALEKSNILRTASKKVFLLSPFDNFIIQRVRLKNLFDFDYAIECFTPPAKRKYGYFTLPILWGEKLVGRLDPKIDRKKKAFIIRNLVFEPDFKEYEAFVFDFTDKLWDFAEFNRCQEIQLEKATPVKMLFVLTQIIKRRRTL
jgi:uncharacterized protein YcaQ